MGKPTVVTASSKFDSRRHGSTQYVDIPSLGRVDRKTLVHSRCALVSLVIWKRQRTARDQRMCGSFAHGKK